MAPAQRGPARVLPGVGRGVLVQPGVYGTEHRAMLAEMDLPFVGRI